MTVSRFFTTIAAVISCLSIQEGMAADPLPAFGAAPTETSVSGLSSGAFMAVQYEVAFSNSVKGAGIVAGGPYYCAAGLLANAAICMGKVPFVPPNPYLMVAAAQEFAALQKIDPLSGLEDDRVYVFSGTKDTVVNQQAVDATVGFFKLAGINSSNLDYVNNVEAGHAFITPSFGNLCATNSAPFINQCKVNGKGYDQAGALLKHIYGTLNAPAKSLTGSFVTFDQRAFATASTGMSENAFLYVPKSCSNGTSCRVHVALHGCLQSAAKVGDDFYKDTGYNRWADTNQILVLYPQVDPSTVPFNPNGCWDWFGYTGPDYATKSGAQLAGIKAMVDRLISK